MDKWTDPEDSGDEWATNWSPDAPSFEDTIKEAPQKKTRYFASVDDLLASLSEV